jgi:prepilin-type N-terminal cleavage/methylation domain-containing protein
MQMPRAFTLVEVLTVMVILGIVAAFVLPQIGKRDDLDVAAAARCVTADLLYAQSRAISTQKKHVVEFTSGGYSVLARDSDATPLYAITNPTTLNNYLVTFGAANSTFPTVLIPSVNLDASLSKAIQFDSLGAPSVYNPQQGTATPLVDTGTITLGTTTSNLTTTILIDPATGEASTQ